MDNYFTSFFYLPSLELTIFEQNVDYANTLSLGDKKLQKRDVTTLNSAHQAKKQGNFDSGWLERQQSGLQSFFWILWT